MYDYSSFLERNCYKSVKLWMNSRLLPIAGTPPGKVYRRLK